MDPLWVKYIEMLKSDPGYGSIMQGFFSPVKPGAARRRSAPLQSPDIFITMGAWK
jgi:hypothetical protein